MDNGEVIIKLGQVESVEDAADGLRVKIRLGTDGNEPLENLPYAFPLLPKTFQSPSDTWRPYSCPDKAECPSPNTTVQRTNVTKYY